MTDDPPKKLLRVYDEQTREWRILDTSDALHWGPVEDGEDWQPIEGYWTWFLQITLYRKPSKAWFLVTDKCHVEAPDWANQVNFRRLTDQEAVDWLLLNEFAPPADVAHLGACRMLDGPLPEAPAKPARRIVYKDEAGEVRIFDTGLILNAWEKHGLLFDDEGTIELTLCHMRDGSWVELGERLWSDHNVATVNFLTDEQAADWLLLHDYEPPECLAGVIARKTIGSAVRPTGKLDFTEPATPADSELLELEDAADTSFVELREFVDEKMKGKQRKLVLLIIDAGGRYPIEDLGPAMGWNDPPGNYNSTKREANKKLESMGWELLRHADEARLSNLSVRNRSNLTAN